jgi:hypothetical protein
MILRVPSAPRSPVPQRIARHPFRCLLAAFLVLIAFANSLRAELKWDTQRIDLRPRVVDTMAEGKFGFVNAGKEAVTIESVKSSCGCTVPTLAKTKYAPGERGEVTARFNIGDRRGAQSATIRVSVKGEPQPTLLTLKVAIPEVAKMTRRLLVWAPGEKAETKTIDVEALPNQPVRVVKVTSSVPNFEARVETIAEAAKYRIIVKPGSTEQSGFAALNIETQINEGVNLKTAVERIFREK